MANTCASVADSEPKTERFVFLKILTEDDKCVSNSVLTTRELPSKYFHPDELQFLVPSNGQSNDLKHGISENMIITRQTTDQNARNKSSGCATFKNSMAHHEISHKSKQNGTLSRSTASKIEGRKAPGANRILPLITSVWEDADVHRKRQKSPKAGGERRDGKGKISYANKKSVTGDEAEEEWLERWDADDLGGSIYRAYTDFFMAEEAGEDREDCICSECGAEFLTATHVACHLESFHDKGVTKLHQCFVCRRKRYPSPLQLNQHLSEAHGIPRPQLTCRTCFMELAGESEAKAHSRKHQTPYKCSRCPLSHSQNGHCASVPRFATRFLLAEHLREVHLPSERPYVCSICGRHFIHEFVRDLHLQRRHMGHSLICPRVHHRQSSSCEEIALLSSKDFFNDTSVNSFTSNISPIFNRSVSEDGGENCGRASSFTENEDHLTFCKQDQVFVNHKKKRCEQFPENFMLIQQHSSLCCPNDSFLFPDEVSLLRHVFKCHDKPTRVQLLKWAREVDREDTLFEELWKVYLNTSNKQSALNITLSEENKIASFIPNQSDVRVLPTSERLSVNIYSLNKQHGNENSTKNVVGKRSIPVKQDELLELSRVINTSNNCSDDKAIFTNDAVLSATFPQGINKSLQCNTNLTAEYSSVPASVTASLHRKSFVESTLSHIEKVYNVSSVSATIQPFIPDTDSQKNKSPTRSLENPIEGMQTNISDSVNFCLTDILDTVCDVLNGRSSLKELKNLPGHGCVQRGLSSVRCSLCRYLASNALALERHRRRRHFRNKHCPFCSLACLSVDAVWRHVSETHLSSSIKEEVDHDVSKVGPEELQQKIQSQKLVQSSSGLRCPVCKKTFSSRGKCNSHQENVHKIEVVSRPLRCSICSKKFQFQKALERHNLLHSQDKLENGTQTPYGCPHCEQTFLRPGFLKRHVASHFEDIRKEGKGKAVAANSLFGHSCLSCSRRLPTHAKLKAHMRTSHPPSHLRQRFVCSQCPVRCNTASGLRIHMRVHTGERPYPCNECNMSFKRQTALRKHLVAVHVVPSESSASETAGTGSFLQCPNCSSSFRDRSNLVRHFLQVHRGLRRFVCGLCGAKYGQNQDLRRHLKVNHDVDAPRIIGSDRRSVDQIYVVPPVIDDLPFDHPLVNKIRVIVEEEERKLNEDGIPHFTETPQQLHLHIHKEPVIKNAESTSDENKDTEPRSHIDHDSIKSPESAFDERYSSVLCPKASVRNMSKSNIHKVIEQASFLGDNKKTLDSKSTSVQLSSRVEIMIENKESEDKNLPQPQRNLILDALISSQISSDAIQHDNSILYMEEVSQLGQVFGSNCSTAKSLDNDTPQAIEMNIIMTKQRLDSEHLKSSLQKSEDKSLIAADAIKIKEETSRMYPVVQGNFPCCHCGKEFIDAARLERHYKVHSDLKPHICSVCGKSFVEKYNLKVHMRTHTGERPYKCESCGKKVRYLKELADHRRMHLGERPHTCDICSRAFLRLRDLQRHLQIHLSKKKHQCPICNKAFSRLDHLRAVHMRVHDPWRSETSKTSDKALESVSDENGLKLNAAKNPIVRCTTSEKEIYECQKCNKKFSTRAKLDKHLVLHSGQKAHKCSACGRSFALASYLRAHQNTHRKQQAYLQCPKCPRRFVSQETLSVHDDKFHRRIEKMKKFQSSELNEKAGRSKDLSVDICDEERFFMTRTGDFDVNLNLEEEMSIQEVLFDPTSLPESEKHNTFVYLHVISDDLQLANESGFTE